MSTQSVRPVSRELRLLDGRRVWLSETHGRGGLATVYRGELEGAYRVYRTVAIKVFEMHVGEHEQSFQILAGLARLTARVTHTACVATYDVDRTHDGRPLLVLEHIDGPTLERVCDAFEKNGQRMPLDMALLVGTRIAEAVFAAHTATGKNGPPLVHAALTSRQVFVSKAGEVKVGDFGVASAMQVGSMIRKVGKLAQRLRTVAPEVAMGRSPGVASDVFALGVMLHELLVGPRFPADCDDGTVAQMVAEGRVHTPIFGPQLPAALRAIVARALDPNLATRYPSAGELAAALRTQALLLGISDGPAFLRHALAPLFAPPPLPQSESARTGSQPTLRAVPVAKKV
jgi:serine/threonine-protein kinase